MLVVFFSWFVLTELCLLIFSIQGLHTLYTPLPEPNPKTEPTKMFDRSEPVQKINKFKVQFGLGLVILLGPNP